MRPGKQAWVHRLRSLNSDAAACNGRAASSRRKHQIESLFRHGSQLHAAGRLAEAEATYRQVLLAVPRHAGSLHMLGVLALQSGQADAALELIAQAIAVRPAEAIYHVNRATALLAKGAAEEAAAECRHALSLKRNSAERARCWATRWPTCAGRKSRRRIS